jgi:hypothetical protein
MNEITTTTGQPPAELSVVGTVHYAALIAEAMRDKNFNVANFQIMVETHERLLDKQRAYEAECAYNVALSEAQAEMPTVMRDTPNPHTKSRYAKLDQVIPTCQPIWTRHGFAVTFYDVDAKVEGYVRLGMEVRHKAGYVVRHEREVPSDMAGARGNANKTPIQGDQSARSYLQRTMTLAFWGIAQEGADDDGNLGRDDPADQFPDKKSPPARTAVKLPEPVARDPNSWLGKAEKWIDGADGDPAWIKRHEETAKKCPTLDDLNNLEDDFARSIAKAPPAVSTPIKAAWGAARKRLTDESKPVDRQSSTNSDSNEAAKEDTPEFVLHDEPGDVMGAYATALEFATEFMDLWRIADDPPKLEEMNADTLAEARAADPEAAKVLAELGTMANDDPLLTAVPVPMKNGKQDWSAYRSELRNGLRDAIDVEKWFDAQRATLSGASKMVQQVSAKELIALCKEPDHAPVWLCDMMPKAAKPKHTMPPIENDPEQAKADKWIKDLQAMPVSREGRGHFDALVKKSAEMRATMIKWKAAKNALFDTVDDAVREKNEALIAAGF